MDRDNKILIVILLSAAIIFLFLARYVNKIDAECQKKGGVSLHTQSGYVCVKADTIIK